MEIEEINKEMTNKMIFTEFKIKQGKQIKPQNMYIKCYECKKYYDKDESLIGYDYHCLDCGKINYEYKMQKANLENITILITGIRVKIGYHTALRILRNGGNVIGTTRYPNLALNNYAKEKDYEEWKDRLKIIKCDFLKIDQVYDFLDIINNYCNGPNCKFRINGFINMAFRTTKPTEYYNNKVNELETELSSKILIKDSNKQETALIVKNKIDNNYLDLMNIDINNIKNNDIKTNIFKDITDKDKVIKDTAWQQNMSKIDREEIV